MYFRYFNVCLNQFSLYIFYCLTFTYTAVIVLWISYRKWNMFYLNVWDICLKLVNDTFLYFTEIPFFKMLIFWTRINQSKQIENFNLMTILTKLYTHSFNSTSVKLYDYFCLIFCRNTISNDLKLCESYYMKLTDMKFVSHHFNNRYFKQTIF